ncbi:MAG: DNA polymerase IV [Clostridia bacterium]
MRAILHCDLNNFFASVEMLSKPELRSVPMAVSGDPNKRHGIILAKNQIAKKYGVYTPETVYSALKKCPNLVLVKPHFEEYEKYSKLVNEVYRKYTDRVEKFGIDESFLDVTESTKIFGTPYQIAYKIKEEIKSRFNLTISVGVSFTKSLAKLGSDLKKPDAITVLDFNSYKEKIYNLPVNMLLYVGKNTNEKLKKMGIKTIGDLALSNKYRVIKHLGKLGEQIHNYANGIDNEPVKYYYEKDERKSISKGITFESDISDVFILEKEFLKLSSKVAFLLRKNNMKANIVSIILKDSNFISNSRQKKIEYTNYYEIISKNVIELLRDNYINGIAIRYICVGVSGLKREDDEEQIDMFSILNENKIKNLENVKKEKVTKTMDKLKEKYGDKIDYASTIKKM